MFRPSHGVTTDRHALTARVLNGSSPSHRLAGTSVMLRCAEEGSGGGLPPA
jgi:hypothetical protein